MNAVAAKASMRLDVLKEQAMRELDAIAVKYSNDIRWKLCDATSYIGITTKREQNSFTIAISTLLLDPRISDENVKDTIIHELIHTVPGCFNHQTGFKRIAALVNDCYACYNIKRTSDYDELGISKEMVAEHGRKKTSYTVHCCKCSKDFFYKKKTRLIQLLQMEDAKADSFSCPYCQGNKFTLL